jgi:hypothetical protein
MTQGKRVKLFPSWKGPRKSRTAPSPVIGKANCLSKPFVLLNKIVRPERFELPAFSFIAEQGQNLSACSGVAYEPKNTF